MNTITINNELCIGCQICFKSCFIDVIKWDNTTGKPIVKYPQECVQCGYCEINCPKRAVKVEPDYKSYLFPRANLNEM